MRTDLTKSTSAELGRFDFEIAAAVNRGLAAALLSDAWVGEEVMRKEGVPSHVMRRVLKNPQQRRLTDWK